LTHNLILFFSRLRRTLKSTLFPYTTLFRSKKIKTLPPASVQTGPARRNDQTTLKKHLQLLEKYPEQKKIYALFTSLIKNYYHERSEEHTSELQSRSDLVCRLLLEKKKTNTK